MTDSSFVLKWRDQLAAATPGLHLADPAHPLEIFVGSSESGAARFVLRSWEKPPLPSLSKLVLVERFQSPNGKWSLVFTLQDNKFDEVFLRLADDVWSRSAPAANEVVALNRVTDVFDQWRRLLRARHRGLLSMDELRGLVGELWLILERFTPAASAEAAVDGWLGPMGLPQDFWFPEAGYIEVKAIGPATVRIRVSSEHQLDADRLELVVLTIANVAEESPSSFNLLGLVSRVAEQLKAECADVARLEDRLSRLGVDLHEPFYTETWFALAQVNRYSVGSDFPAIRASELPAALTRVTYEVALEQMSPFLLEQLKEG